MILRNESIKILDWDTKTFGYQVASIQISAKNIKEADNLILKLKQDNIKLAYWFIDPEDNDTIAEALKNGGKLVDQKIKYGRILNPEDKFIKPEEVKDYYKTEISEKLNSLAIQSSIYSRFKLDKNFKNEEYLSLYSLWIKNSVKKEIANDVMVFLEEEEELGLVTLRYEANNSAIGLLAVDENARGKSVGKKLIQAVFSKTKEKGISEVIVNTQKANKVACGFYEAQGFKLKNITNVYHLWLEKK